MINEKTTNNVFGLLQNEFQAIPGRPWIYWADEIIRRLFIELPRLSDLTKIRQGLATADNFRFLRYWWEAGISKISFNNKNAKTAEASSLKWFPYMKGGGNRKWYGFQDYVLNYGKDGYELKSWASPLYGNSGWSRIIKSTDCYYKEGITYSYLSSISFSARHSPGGFIFDVAGSSLFPENLLLFLAVMNSSLPSYLLRLINPTVNFQVGDLSRLPIPRKSDPSLEDLVINAVQLSKVISSLQDSTFDFRVPASLFDSILNPLEIQERLSSIEKQVDELIYNLYNITIEDRKYFIESSNLDDVSLVENDSQISDDLSDEENWLNKNVLKISWLSYAIGIVLSRFQPGTPSALGSAIYRRSDFAIGSLPEPTEEEFNELVGEPSQFAYIDEQGGRHVFSRQVEQALQKLTLTDGIAVFDPNHPRDLPSLVSKALELMLGQAQAQEVIQQAAGGDLRKFLEKDFFTQHHIKQYRKRPVYWPIQSYKRSYGFVLFHEKIDRNTFYALQQEPYLPTKRRAVQLRLEELGKNVLTAQGAARKPIEKEMDELRQLGEELAQLAKDLDAITRGGYEPEADWIDDGVILRMAPLWSVIPLWKSEPKKYWEDLAAGKYDWSRIAMKYWPDRVKKACMKNKSYAIAHGHEEWYKGG